MALELKGLRARMMQLQARMDRLNAIAAQADEKGGELEKHLGDIHGQLGSHVDDLEFAANVLGNSSGASQAPVEQPKPLPATQPAPTQFGAPAPVPDSYKAIPRMEVGQEQSATFHPGWKTIVDNV